MTKTLTFGAAPEVTLAMCADIIEHVGPRRTPILFGHTGWGKTWISKTVAERTGRLGVYFDAASNGLEDLKLPRMQDTETGSCVRMIPSEELGLHHGVPVTVMIDEYGKNRSLQNPLMKFMLERTGLMEGSRVFATTNLTGEGLGDAMMPHHRNRFVLLTVRKPTQSEWEEDFALLNDIDPALIMATRKTPAFFQPYTDVADPKDNPYIYHPKDAARTSFVTGRSLHAASDIIKVRRALGAESTRACLVGTVGAPAAELINTMIAIGDTLPDYSVVAQSPTTARVPDTAAAQIMMALICMQNVQQPEFANVMAYIQRMPMEMVALFAVRLMKVRSKSGWVSQQSAFTAFARKNAQLFT